jgi:hypothetical protein
MIQAAVGGLQLSYSRLGDVLNYGLETCECTEQLLFINGIGFGNTYKDVPVVLLPGTERERMSYSFDAFSTSASRIEIRVESLALFAIEPVTRNGAELAERINLSAYVRC